MKASMRIKNFGLKRAAVAGLAFGLVTMAFDAGLAHFAGRPLKHPAQLIPVAFGAVVVGLLAAIVRTDGMRLARIARTVAVGAIAVGLLGSTYHAIAFMRMLTTDSGVDANLIGVALSIAPPLLAPGAFAGLGAALWALASPRVGLTFAAERHAPLAATA